MSQTTPANEGPGQRATQRTLPFTKILTIGLAIFSMYFGAGNLMFPIGVGVNSGIYWVLGIAGFITTAVLLPLVGLIAMILFDGSYTDFFNRLGTGVGSIFVGTCMFIVGPIIAIPRIVSLSHIMIAPFIPIPFLQNTQPAAATVFALLFLGVTYLAAYRETKIVDLLGNFISPALVVSLVVIIAKGIMSMGAPVATTLTPLQSVGDGFLIGYSTLDLLGSIFFSSAALQILAQTLGNSNKRTLATVGLRSGGLGLSILALIYTGMGILGAYHSHGISGNSGELFREVSMNVVGMGGSFLIGTAVLMACLSTSIALAAVIGEYAQRVIFKNRFSFETALAITLLSCLPLSIAGLDKVLQLTGGPLTFIGYPVLITLTFCNLAYKMWGFKPVRGPVVTTALLATIGYVLMSVVG